MKRIALLLPLLVVIGCNQTVHSPLAVSADPNASPDKQPRGKASTERLVEHAAGIRFDDAQLGHAVVTNTGTPRAFVLVLWNAKNRDNQVFLTHSLDIALGTGETGELSAVLADDRSHCVQRDIYAGVPIALLNAARPTMSDLANYFVGGDEHIWDAAGCIDPPVEPPVKPPCLDCKPTTTCIICPLPPVCSALSFSELEGHVDGITIRVTATVKPAYDGITFYLTPYGVPAARIGNGDLPLPQTAGFIVKQTLHAGENIITAPLVSPATFAGWQWEGGCSEGPNPLTEENYRAFTYLVSGWGNFEVMP